MLTRLLRIATITFAALMLTACGEIGPSEESIQRLGVLKVAIEKSPHIYESNDQIIGFEFDLIQQYAKHLGVKLEPTYVDSAAEVKALVSSHRVQLGIGMLPVTHTSTDFSFGPTIKVTNTVVVAHTDSDKIRSVGDLEGLSIAISDTSLASNPFLPNDEGSFNTTEMPGANADTLLALVDQDAFDAAIITETDFLLLKRKYPYLQKRFTLREAVPLAWIVPKPSSPQLLASLGQFFQSQLTNGYLAKRWHFHYNYLEGFDFVEARAFLRKYASALPEFRVEFEQAAYEHEYDWRLLAALSYQESHWNPDARSPTGVRGLMMLTASTAKELGVSRLDPIQSIHGGTRYLATLQSRLDEEITSENEPLLALAAYNVGFGHLKDAQRVARGMNKDGTDWTIVKAHLPLLAKEKYAKHTRYGRARGAQAVHYVEGVRRYFSVLRLLEPTNWGNPTQPVTPKYREKLSVLF